MIFGAPFDVIVTVGIGTLAASAARPSSPALSDFAAVLLTFLTIQVLLAALRQRFVLFQRWLDFQPTAIYRDGHTDVRRAPLDGAADAQRPREPAPRTALAASKRRRWSCSSRPAR